MNPPNRKEHWDRIYQNNESSEVSWYQPTPQVSLDFFSSLQIPLSASIIDIGGGDSLLVDYLLELGYRNITVLDIAEASLEKAKKRVGEASRFVNWIVADIVYFNPVIAYDVWHDRATFHFLINESDIDKYLSTAENHLHPGGILILGTFSEEGPRSCSGLPIRQYVETTMTDLLAPRFETILCRTVDHLTPFDTVQSFVFCSFKKPGNPDVHP